MEEGRSLVGDATAQQGCGVLRMIGIVKRAELPYFVDEDEAATAERQPARA